MGLMPSSMQRNAANSPAGPAPTMSTRRRACSGNPAASVPCGLTGEGLPIGLQIVGPMRADAMVLRAARAFEEARPFARVDAPRVGLAHVDVVP